MEFHHWNVVFYQIEYATQDEMVDYTILNIPLQCIFIPLWSIQVQEKQYVWLFLLIL